MNWFVISLLPPLFWALSNHVDKYLLSKYFKGESGFSMIFLTLFCYLIALPIVGILFYHQINVGFVGILAMIMIGALGMVSGLFYLAALSKDTPSTVIPLFQLIPVFNYIAGVIFLREHLSMQQIMASLIIIAGSILITLDLTEKKPRMKLAILLLIGASCLMSAVGSTAFKAVAVDSNYWGATFWRYVGSILIGLIFFFSIKKWRSDFIGLVKANNISMLGITFVSESISIIANLIFNFALLIMPIALVSVISNGLQPFFVFFIGVILTLILPHLEHENFGKKHLAQRIIAILIIFAGTYLLNIKG